MKESCPIEHIMTAFYQIRNKKYNKTEAYNIILIIIPY